LLDLFIKLLPPVVIETLEILVQKWTVLVKLLTVCIIVVFYYSYQDNLYLCLCL